jgi:hemerythrin-like metal-binding protein
VRNVAIWNSGFSVGSSLLDSQHRKLLKLCNALGDALSGAPTSAHLDFHEILHELSEYSRQHFATEETMLHSYGYPNLQAQKDDHLEYCRQIAEQSLAATTGMANQINLQQFISQWWTDHILVSDMEYRDFLIARGAT